MRGEFECRREVLLPAPPVRVWQAVASTEGNACWLFPNPIPPDGAGARQWEPPLRFAVRTEQDDWFNELDYTISPRGEDASMLRYVHAGVFREDWTTRNEAVQQHTDFYLHTLGQYLEHFAGRRAAYVGEPPQGIVGPPSTAAPDGFERLQRALGVPAGARAGEDVSFEGAGAGPVEGVVDYAGANFLGVRTGDALYRFFGRNAFGAPVALAVHDFGGADDARESAERWRAWMVENLG